MIISGPILLLTVLNLALGGLGAPFAIALSKRLAVNWLYAWTRNPMVVSTIAFLFSVGIWLQSALFLLWMIVLVTPAWLFFLMEKSYESIPCRELCCSPASFFVGGSIRLRLIVR